MRYSEPILIVVEGLLLYAWILFPLLLWMLARNRAQPALPAGSGQDLPRISILLSAYNEEDHIGGRIRNLLELDYPADRWRAYIGIDGCRDLTAAEAAAAAQGHSNIVVMDFAKNRGKMSVLKDLVSASEADGADLLVFTDANTCFAADSLRELCGPFVDSTVGGVCGKLAFVSPAGAKTEENVYWRFETWLKTRESAIDSCLGANGAIYAIRRELFWKDIPTNTIVDDFVIGMKVRERNYRFLYEPAAVAYEELPATVNNEWKRRVRIGAGNFQSLQMCRACLAPSFGRFAWIFWSHKVLRWFTPHLMLAGVALAGVMLVPGGSLLATATLASHAGITGMAWMGHRSVAAGKPVLRVPRGLAYFLIMQAAILTGFRNFVAGNLEGRWDRTAR